MASLTNPPDPWSREDEEKIMEVDISPMEETDLGTVKKIEDASFRFPWSEGMFREELRSPLSRCRVAKLHHEGRPQVGAYLVCRICAGETHLYNLAVRIDFRRKGLAGLLLEDMADISMAASAKFMYLEVGVSNEAAIKLYNKYGFAKMGIRKGYYSESGENALLMGRNLDAHIFADKM